MDLKPIAIGLIIVIIANLVLFAMGLVSQFAFWMVIILMAFIAFKVFPKYRK